MSLPAIASFWTGGPLSVIEQTVIQSYLDWGHEFTLFIEGEVKGVPPGAILRPAADIWRDPTIDLTQASRHVIATYSDIFRLELLQQTDMIWVDTDAYCVRPFDFAADSVYGLGGKGRVCTGVLRLPSPGVVLDTMIYFVEADCPIQPWRGRRFRKKQAEQKESGHTWRIYDLPWGCAGPKLLSWVLAQHKDCPAPLDQSAFYPLFGPTLRNLLLPAVPLEDIEPSGCYSVHIFGATRKVLMAQHDGIPPAGSYLERIALRHGTMPARAARRAS